MPGPSQDRVNPWAVAAVLSLTAMAITFGLVVPSTRQGRPDDGLVPIGEVVAGLERLRMEAMAEERLRPASLVADAPGTMALRVQRAFARPLELPDLSAAGLVLVGAQVAVEGAPQQSALLAYGDAHDGASAWIGIAEDVGQFAVCDRFGQLIPLGPDELVGDLGTTEEASVYAWRNDGLLWIVMGDDAALLTQVLAGANAPDQGITTSP
ncbi:MAG: hypothetical protein RLZZ217_195 [Planctomycetota bacterium]|jgi:hypothetical protein